MNETPSPAIRTVIRRPQRTLTPEEREAVRGTPMLNFQGALIMGIVDPVPNPSPMGEDEGVWVREQVWPAYLTEIDSKYPFGFYRWSTCERGTCRNCLATLCDLCVHRQEGGPLVDDNTDLVHNPSGRGVAQLILRPDDALCVWWCRCPCPKDGSVNTEPAAPIETEAGPAKVSPSRWLGRGPARGNRRLARADEPADETQGALF